jgi:glycine cleavage system H protein
MAQTLYTKDHEYVRVEGDVGVVGITDYAQNQLGDVVFVELPTVGKAFRKGEQAAVVESVKAASEVYAPISGEIIDANAALEDAPALVNEDSAGRGWFVKMRVADRTELDGLMDEAAYAEFLKTVV